MLEIDCPFRFEVRTVNETEVATCGFLERITGVTHGGFSTVDRTACEACCAVFSSSPARLSPVLPSLVYNLCEQVLEQDQVEKADEERLRRLRRWAEASFAEAEVPELLVTHSCDVIVCCTDSSDLTRRAIQSALDQEDSRPIVHLIDDGGKAGHVISHFAGRSNVIVHHNPAPKGLFASLHDLAGELHTQYIAIQDPRTTSRPSRIATSVSILDQQGAEFFGASLQTPDEVIAAESPGGQYKRCIPTSTLVFRRPSLIDLGGISDRALDGDVELVFRAFAEGRPFAIAQVILADSTESCRPDSLGPPPEYAFRDGLLRHYGRGYASSTIACDVILPFYGHFDYVEEALEGVLTQEQAEVVIHLVDDDSPEDASGLLRKWNTHPQVRTYKNTRNIGQFASFNNVIPFVETALVAVQDADDISLPRRICTAGNLLRLADGDIFGGRVEMFGDDWVVTPTNQLATDQTKVQRGSYRVSKYPAATRVGYYVENPTIVMRTESFRALGGYADFGERIRNRTGLDTEFLLRAFYAGTRVAVTRQCVLRYRVHGDSATQNTVSGWGTPARTASQIENHKREMLFRRGRFDPRVFGGLNSHRGITKRIHANKTFG